LRRHTLLIGSHAQFALFAAHSAFVVYDSWHVGTHVNVDKSQSEFWLHWFVVRPSHVFSHELEYWSQAHPATRAQLVESSYRSAHCREHEVPFQ